MLMLDGTSPMTVEDENLLNETEKYNRLVLLNKCDLAQMPENKIDPAWLRISALTEQGLPELEKSLVLKLTDGQGVEAGASSAANAPAGTADGGVPEHT